MRDPDWRAGICDRVMPFPGARRDTNRGGLSRSSANVSARRRRWADYRRPWPWTYLVTGRAPKASVDGERTSGVVPFRGRTMRPLFGAQRRSVPARSPWRMSHS